MKILKIALQNINSLQSNTPIVIDFESDSFKDVGLYAITGATGAGKTTILDAITIALYHNVPRFNGTKGALIDSVSHNANEAFSSVTFENNTIIYEAFWGIRVANKFGKKYKNAKEEVRLKNLSTGVILATQKRALISEVNKVTQLNYTQFLRSVMLAQGEFASFLSAKGPEKGKLLEQITGEEIYKKIGQGILNRKSNEENKLKEIQSKINADDVLTDDDKILLTQKDKALDIDIIKTEKDIISIQLLVNWYIDFQKTIDQSKQLEEDSKDLAAFIEKYKTLLKSLDLNEKAEPFTTLIQNLNRSEKEYFKKTNQLKIIEDQLTVLKPNIEGLKKQTKIQAAELEIATKEFTEWLPKFDLITKLDGQLKNEFENKQKATQELNELTQKIELLKKEAKNLTTNLTDTKSKIKNNETFLTNNKFLKDVDLEISNWTRALTTLNSKKQTLIEDSKFVTQKNKEIIKTSLDQKENLTLLTKKIVEVDKIEKEFTTVTTALAKTNLTDVLAQKEKSTLTESTWKQFQNLSKQTIKVQKEQAGLVTQKNIYSTDLKNTKKQIEEVKNQIETQEKAVVDATKILDLEKSIAKYEDDRQNLIKGEPCGLCGAKEHPFTENLKIIDVSKSELELNKREKTFKILTDSKNKLDRDEVKLNTTIDGLTKQIESITEELKTLKATANKLNITCEITNVSKINTEINLVTEQIKLLDENLKTAQQLQITKNELSDSLKTQNQSVNALKTKEATLTENIKNAKTEVENKQKSIDDLSKACTDLETILKTQLGKFNYDLPSIAQTNLFIKEIEELIIHFNNRQKSLDLLKAASKLIDSKLNNNKKQLETYNKDQNDYIKIINECVAKSNKLRTKRNDILPIAITVESKREGLQASKNQIAKKVELSKKELQKLLDSKTEKKALKVKNNKEQKDLIAILGTLKSTLDLQIENSDFDSRQDIEKAILTKEDKLKYTQNKELIKEKQHKLNTLKEANLKAKEDLNKSKNFDTSEAESKLTLEELNTKNKLFLTERGKIAEAFRKNQEIRDRNQEIYKKIDAQAAICGIWNELYKIIGNSKDAFNVYVQRLTLKHLLDLANVHLYKLNKRYSLKMEEAYKPKEELNFNLIDHYQTDQTRLVDTSSGGEKFIISLALALGLSDLASKNVKIDSLFIDEGFGTLDNNTLETVIATLETLQSQGKMIGIISHVENLKERIPTQIQITKKSNGVSVVKII